MNTASRDQVDAPPLRVGVILDDVFVRKWVLAMLRAIEAQKIGAITLFLLTDAVKSSRHSRRPMLWRAYERFDSLLFNGSFSAIDPTPVETVFPDAKVARIVGEASARSSAEGSRAAGTHEERPDVVLHLGSRDVDVLHAARKGVFTLTIGGRHVHDEGIFFWDLHDGWPTSDVMITFVETENGNERLLYRCSIATDPLSPSRMHRFAAAKLTHYVLERLRRLQLSPAEPFRHFPASESTPPADAAPLPTARTILIHTPRILGRAVARLVENTIRRESWYIAYRRATCGTALETPFRSYSLLLPARGRSVMDPFLFSASGTTYLFFEEMPRRGKAVISFVELDSDQANAPTVALERDYHLSYPFLFSHEDEIYLIPESRANRGVELYRADPFPGSWHLERILLRDVAAADSTLVEHDGRFWLFTSVAVPDDSTDDELHLYWADRLDGEWTPHPLNPVVADAQSARPAGRIFSLEGKLYRPSQDCTPRYGFAVVFNVIEVLTTTEYVEVPCGRIDSTWVSKNIGTHSYACGGGFEAIDGRSMVLKIGRR